MKLTRCHLLRCFCICPAIVKILPIVSLISSPSVHGKFLSEFGSRKSFAFLGNVVCFLFSHQNDLCVLSHFPLSPVCQEDCSWSFHSVTTTWLTAIFWIFTFLFLYLIKNLVNLFCLPFTKCLISYLERGETEMYVCIYL